MSKAVGSKRVGAAARATVVLALIAAAVMLVGCGDDDGGYGGNPGGGGSSKRQPVNLSDSRFNGSFQSDGVGNKFVRYTFNGTSHVEIYMNEYEFIFAIQVREVEWEISGGRYRGRNWSDDIYVNNSWSEWQNYSFSGDGRTLTIQTAYGSQSFKKQ